MVEIVLPDNMDLPDFLLGCCMFFFVFLLYFFYFCFVVVDVVTVSAVLRMGDSRATTFGSRCFNKSVISRCVSDFRGLFCTVVPC